MKTKTSELAGPALDWAVGHALRLALGYDYEIVDGVPVTGKTIYTREGLGFDEVWSPSTNWAQGGPCIEWKKIELRLFVDDGSVWYAHLGAKPFPADAQMGGPTPLVAAMRCCCCAELGEEVDVPEELARGPGNSL